MSRFAQDARLAPAPPGPGSLPGRAAAGGAPGPTAGASGGERLVHLLVLVLCLGAVGGALLLAPAPEGAPAGLSLAGVTLPEVCAFKSVTGVPCPGCGLTRSWVAALHGHWRGSLAHHPLGWLFLLYALAQAARHGAWLALPGRRNAIERLGRPLDRGLIVLAVLLAMAWVPVLARAF